MATVKRNTPPVVTTYDITGLTEVQAIKLHALLGVIHTDASLGDVWRLLDEVLSGASGRDRFTIEAAGDGVEITDVFILRITDNRAG